MAVRSGKGRRLSPERRLQLYREFQQAGNKAELAAWWGIDRSHLYEIVRDCEEALLESFSGRKVGRRPKGVPATLAEATERIRELEQQHEREATKREEYYCLSEMLALQLKWARVEAAEARGEPVDEALGGEKKAPVRKREAGSPAEDRGTGAVLSPGFQGLGQEPDACFAESALSLAAGEAAREEGAGK